MAVAYESPARENPGLKRMSFAEFVAAFREAIFALIAPVIILGGILLGVFTPTEAAVVAVAYAFFVGVFIFRELRMAEIPKILVQSGITTSILLLVIGTANILAWVLSAEQIPQKIAEMMLGVSKDPYFILFLINLFLLVVGMFMEGGAAIIILAPVLAQVAQAVGLHPLHFGFVMVLNLTLGLLTPPLGVCLFVACGIARISLETLVKAIYPFLIVEIGVLFLCSYLPWVVLWIPRLVGYV
jgi:C4-dicarboxylate transporter DctM subunit